jgi:hypothetical protein
MMDTSNLIDFHSHECPECFHVWSHENPELKTEGGCTKEEYARAHTCPNPDCGETEIYDRVPGSTVENEATLQARVNRIIERMLGDGV